MKTWVLFDWGNTLMRAFPEYRGPMYRWPKIEEMPGAHKALHALHGKVGIAMATHAPGETKEEEIREALSRVGLDSFIKRIYFSHAMGLRKSDAAFYSHILQDLRIDPDHAVMVGDDYADDVEAPRAAGLRAVWFNPKTQENKVATHVTTIHHLEALPGVLMAWGLLPRA